MGAIVEDKNRKVIPRWRPSRLVTTLGESTSIHKVTARAPEAPLFEKLDEWHRQPTLSLAAEVVGASVVLGRESDAREAAQAILAARDKSPWRVQELAALILEPHHMEPRTKTQDLNIQTNNQIRLLRQRLRSNPRNSVAWADLSWEYAALGLRGQATRAMKVGVSLAPYHRFILRSASRLFVHLGDPEYAHYLLLRSPTTASDPWLMAAEIAVAGVAEARAEFVKDGLKLIRAEKFSPWHLSELAAALGTTEFEHGNQRAGRRHFQQALVSPTDNTVGQARWVQRTVGLELLDPSAFSTRGAFEARAWQQFYEGSWRRSVSETESWLADEPYSSRPAALGSYVAGSVLEQYDQAVLFARMGLRANPGEMTLLNNLAFSLIHCGELIEAEQTLQRLQAEKLNAGHEILFQATNGLLRFRQGDSEGGRQLYLAAIRLAEAHNDSLLGARAAIFLAMEEKRAKSTHAREAYLRAIDCARSIDFPDIKLHLSRL